MRHARFVRNSLAVGFATLTITGTLFASVTLASSAGSAKSASGYPTSVAQSAGGTLTCPATGCTASSCHATQGGGHGGRGQDLGSGEQPTDGYLTF